MLQTFTLGQLNSWSAQVESAKVFCNTGCRRRREKGGRRKRLQERLLPKWRADYSLRVRTPHDLSVRVLWLEWQWPLPVAYALFLLASCFLKRVAVAAPFCHSHRVPWKGLGHWARDLPCHSHSFSGSMTSRWDTHLLFFGRSQSRGRTRSAGLGTSGTNEPVTVVAVIHASRAWQWPGPFPSFTKHHPQLSPM